MDWLSDLFSNSSWLGPALGAGAMIYGANKAASANEQAARIAQQGAQQAQQQMLAQEQQAQARYDNMAATAAPGTDYLRGVVATNPYQLTPAQETQMDNTRRNALATLSASGLRGAGRAVTASINNVDNTGAGQMIQSNLQRADQAAGTLNSNAMAANTNAAQADTSLGNNLANTTLNAADTAANATTANGGVQASTMGALGSMFATAAKDNARDSTYQNYKRSVGAA